MSLYCLDTNICIDLLRGRSPALIERFRAQTPGALRLSALVLAELLLGAAQSARPRENRLLIDQFAAPITILPFDAAAAVEYAQVRQVLEKAGTPIGPNDMIIAATVLACRGILITHNQREFTRVPGLRVEDWTE